MLVLGGKMQTKSRSQGFKNLMQFTVNDTIEIGNEITLTWKVMMGIGTYYKS